MTDLIKIPNEGRKPDWLEDDALVSDEEGPPVRVIGAHWAKWFDPTYTFCLPADHWAAPVLRAGLTPWNPTLQGDGPPKDYAGGKVMYRSDTPSFLRMREDDWASIIGYERVESDHDHE